MTLVQTQRLGVVANSLPVQSVFLHEDAGGKRISSVVWHHRNFGLRQDATAVNFFTDSTAS